MQILFRPLSVLLLLSVPISITGCKNFFIPECQAQNNCTSSTTTTTTNTGSGGTGSGTTGNTGSNGSGSGTGSGTTGNTGSNGSGTGTGTGTTGNTGSNGAASRLPASYLYVADRSAATLAAYSIRSGQVAALSAPALPAPAAVAAAPHAAWLYTATASGQIDLHRIQNDGSIAPAGSQSVATVPGASAMAVNSAGNRLYIATAASTLETFAIDPASGRLSGQGSIALSPGAPRSMLLSADDRSIFISLGSGGIDTIDAQSTRDRIAPLHPGAGDSSLAVADNLLFAAEAGAGIRIFSIPSAGSPVEVPGSPFAAAASLSSLAARDHLLYAADPATRSVATFSIAADGSLTPAGALPLEDPAANLALDATGATLLAIPAAAQPQVLSPPSPSGTGN